MNGRSLAVAAFAGLAMLVAADVGRATEATGPHVGVPPAVTWVCETHAVVVAPEAASSKGTFKLRTTPESGEAGVWVSSDLQEAHKGSFLARHPGCATGCGYSVTANATRFELWAPKKIAPSAMPKGEPMTVATLDLTTGRLRASSFIDNAIAALEQGTCKAGE